MNRLSGLHVLFVNADVLFGVSQHDVASVTNLSARFMGYYRAIVKSASFDELFGQRRNRTSSTNGLNHVLKLGRLNFLVDIPDSIFAASGPPCGSTSSGCFHGLLYHSLAQFPWLWISRDDPVKIPIGWPIPDH